MGDVLVIGEILNWEYYKWFENMFEEDIEVLML